MELEDEQGGAELEAGEEVGGGESGARVAKLGGDVDEGDEDEAADGEAGVGDGQVGEVEDLVVEEEEVEVEGAFGPADVAGSAGLGFDGWRVSRRASGEREVWISAAALRKAPWSSGPPMGGVS